MRTRSRSFGPGGAALGSLIRMEPPAEERIVSPDWTSQRHATAPPSRRTKQEQHFADPSARMWKFLPWKNAGGEHLFQSRYVTPRCPFLDRHVPLAGNRAQFATGALPGQFVAAGVFAEDMLDDGRSLEDSDSTSLARDNLRALSHLRGGGRDDRSRFILRRSPRCTRAFPRERRYLAGLARFQTPSSGPVRDAILRSFKDMRRWRWRRSLLRGPLV
jgi:hypothetical protein